MLVLVYNFSIRRCLQIKSKLKFESSQYVHVYNDVPWLNTDPVQGRTAMLQKFDFYRLCVSANFLADTTVKKFW